MTASTILTQIVRATPTGVAPHTHIVVVALQR